ncbi:MAG: FAD-dependent oxidoreductase [Chloroflexi bacterium]|nr:FAD-dependent oxidoreductase [Chloroflexota bacterium]
MSDGHVRMYGTTWCIGCKRARKFFGERRVPYEFIDVEADPEALHVVEEATHGRRTIPTIFLPDGSVLIDPSNTELAEKLELKTRPECLFYDLVIIGGGPAGLTAAIYTAREGIETLLVEKSSFGGQPGSTERIDNFPGFPEGIGGADFVERLVEQCRRYGAELVSATEAVAIGADGNERWVKLASGTEVRCWAVLIAVGSLYRHLGVPGEEQFLGSGIHFCATCDGPFYRGKEVLVVGGGNTAVQAAIFLTKFASRVLLVTHGSDLSASKIVQEAAFRLPKIEVIYDNDIDEFRGDGRLNTVVLHNVKTGHRREIHPDGAFVFIGLQPNTDWLKGTIELDEAGFIVTSQIMQTNLPGVFAAGDVRSGSTKQLVSAAGEGATAALMARQYLQQVKVVPVPEVVPVPVV